MGVGRHAPPALEVTSSLLTPSLADHHAFPSVSPKFAASATPQIHQCALDNVRQATFSMLRLNPAKVSFLHLPRVPLAVLGMFFLFHFSLLSVCCLCLLSY